MASRKRRKKKDNSASYFLIGIIVLLLIAVVVAIVVKVVGNSGAQPENSPTVAITATPEPTGSANIVYTAPPQSGSPEPSQDVTPVPSIQQATLQVPEDKIFAIHLTVDSGEQSMDDFDQLFDDQYTLSEPADELSGIKLIIFVTDYRGNSRVSYFDSTDATIMISKFLLNGQTTAIDALAQVDIRVDGAQNLHLTWNGKTVRIDAEGTDSTGIMAEHEGYEITVSAHPLGLFNKSDYQ